MTAVVALRLFIAGDTPNSAQALGNLNAVCDRSLAGRCDIEIVDVFQDPGRALAEGVFMTPTLVKMSPGPVQRLVGTLADTRALLLALGLEASAA